MMRITLIIFLSVFILSCKNENQPSAPVETNTSTQIEYIENKLPPLGQEVFDTLFKNTTFIDYIWHDLPFSVSQAEPEAVRTNVTFISANGINKVPKNCKSIGRKSYQFNGDIYLDADIYYGEGCAYYIFIKDNKPVYLNAITEEGQKFYANLIQSGMQQRQKVIEEVTKGSN